MGIRATKQEISTVAQSENLPHYVWLAGGPQQIAVAGIGESAVGFDTLPRRTLCEIIPIKVGARIENVLGEAALSNPNFDRLQDSWHSDPRRIQTKSARAICQELL